MSFIFVCPVVGRGDLEGFLAFRAIFRHLRRVTTSYSCGIAILAARFVGPRRNVYSGFTLNMTGHRRLFQIGILGVVSRLDVFCPLAPSARRTTGGQQLEGKRRVILLSGLTDHTRYPRRVKGGVLRPTLLINFTRLQRASSRRLRTIGFFLMVLLYHVLVFGGSWMAQRRASGYSIGLVRRPLHRFARGLPH